MKNKFNSFQDLVKDMHQAVEDPNAVVTPNPPAEGSEDIANDNLSDPEASPLDADPNSNADSDDATKDPKDPEVTEDPKNPDATLTDDDVDGITDWDTEATPEGEGDVNEGIKLLAQELQLESASTTEEVVESIKGKINSLNEKIEELSSLDPLSGVPNELKKAVDIAKTGGDYSAYLGVSTVNYDAYSDYDLYVESVAEHFINPDNTLDKERLEEYVNKLTDDQIRIEGSKIRRELKGRQEQAVGQIENDSRAAKEKFEADIKTALNKFNEVDGFKLQAHHKDGLFKDFQENNVINNMFYTNGQLDPDKAITNWFRAKYFDKISKFYESNARSSATKKVIDTMTEPDLKTNSASSIVGEPVVESHLDKLMGSFKEK